MVGRIGRVEVESTAGGHVALSLVSFVVPIFTLGNELLAVPADSSAGCFRLMGCDRRERRDPRPEVIFVGGQLPTPSSSLSTGR